MDYSIRTDLRIELYGISGVAEDQDWAGAGMALMNRMWQVVRASGLRNNGINAWVYEPDDWMFSGVGLEAPPPDSTGLVRKEVYLPKYAYYKHVGSYTGIKTVFPKIKAELQAAELKPGLPYLEIYGHWTPDESKLETELLWNLLG